jgi:hypothetical protein
MQADLAARVALLESRLGLQDKEVTQYVDALPQLFIAAKSSFSANSSNDGIPVPPREPMNTTARGAAWSHFASPGETVDQTKYAQSSRIFQPEAHLI